MGGGGLRGTAGRWRMEEQTPAEAAKGHVSGRRTSTNVTGACSYLQTYQRHAQTGRDSQQPIRAGDVTDGYLPSQDEVINSGATARSHNDAVSRAYSVRPS